MIRLNYLQVNLLAQLASLTVTNTHPLIALSQHSAARCRGRRGHRLMLQKNEAVPHQRPLALLAWTLVAASAGVVTGLVGPRTVDWLPGGFTKPVLAIGFVDSPEAFRAIAAQPSIDPPQAWTSELLWWSTLADQAFVAAYGLMWFRILLMAGGLRRRLPLFGGIGAIVTAVAADYLENWGIIHGLHATRPPVEVIRLAATVKWAALGIAFTTLVPRFWFAAGSGTPWLPRLNRAVGTAYGAAALLTLAGVAAVYAGYPEILELSPWPLLAALGLQIPLFALAQRHRPTPEIDETFTESVDAVRNRELEYTVRRRTPQTGQPPAISQVANTLVGLSLSGGGIRSATTNLGVLQALSRMGILPAVDYLSTVSGGGYIGSCLTALLSIRQGSKPGDPRQFKYGTRRNLWFGTAWRQFPFNAEVRRAKNGAGCGPHADDSPGKQIVAHLRTHGNFLIARRGIFKKDALRAAGHLLTGTLYHLLTSLVVLFVLALLLMAAAHAIEPDLVGVLSPPVPDRRGEIAQAVPQGGAAASYVITEDRSTWQQKYSERIARAATDVVADLRNTALPWALVWGAGATTVVFLLLVIATRLGGWPRRWGAGETQDDRLSRIVLRAAAGIVLVAVVAACAVHRHSSDTSIGWIVEPFLVVTGARIMSFLLYVVIVTRAHLPRLPWLHLWSREFRSLWGSFQAVTTYGMIATLLFALLPVLAYAAAQVSFWAALAPAVALVVSRLLVTESVGRAGDRWRVPKGLLHALLGLAVLVFLGVGLVEAAGIAVDFEFDRPTGQCANGFILALGVFGAALVGLSLLGDLNRIGPHYFYRDRLLETYLRTEVPDAQKHMITLTDATAMRLQDLHGTDPTDGEHCGNTAPYMLMSAAVNLAGSRDLTRKDRKSGYFLFSKYYCGSRQTGYRKSEAWRGGDTTVGRAVTVSGAAVSTAMGSKTFFAEAFVTAVFNLRLGYWMSNPRTNAGDRLVFWPKYMLQEIFSATSERTRLVNLSDGGHTGDNIGIYPLLERRCQVIIASDAEGDKDLSFGSFTEALRHAYVDLGIDVDIDLSMLRPDPETGLSKSHCAVGRIRYPECPDRPNWLVYMKNSLTGDEPAPVQNYRATCPDFPHESTADQFFDDAQFESYRALGVHIAERTFAAWAAQGEVAAALSKPE